VEWHARKTEVLAENLSQKHFVHRNCQGSNPLSRGGKSATNRLSYGTVFTLALIHMFELFFVINQLLWSRIPYAVISVSKPEPQLFLSSSLVVRVPGYRSRGPDSIPGATTFSEK
jgi:hypothetical protein